MNWARRRLGGSTARQTFEAQIADLARMPPVNAGSGCGACKTGAVDSREAVDERTGRYLPRVPVLQAPLTPIRLHVPGSRVSGVTRFCYDITQRLCALSAITPCIA